MTRKKNTDTTIPVNEPKDVEVNDPKDVETGIIEEVKKLSEAVDKLTLIVCRLENRLNNFTGGYN